MVSVGLLITLFLIGLLGAIFSGFLGLGGAIILVPLLLYVPSLIGVGNLDMKEHVSGITIIVVLASSLSGLLMQNKNRLVSRDLVLIMGVTAAITAFLGSIYSKHTSSEVILVVFAVMSSFAAVLMFLPKKEAEEVAPEDVKFNKALAFLIALVLGFIGGMVGAPGAYVITPLMIYFLKIPTKVAIGSTMGVAFAAAITTAIGKLGTAQVPYLMTAAVVIGAVPGARIGAKFTKKAPAAMLRIALALVIVFAAGSLWIKIIQPPAKDSATAKAKTTHSKVIPANNTSEEKSGVSAK